MRHDPPLAYHLHRIGLAVLFSLVALLLCIGAVVAAEPVWHGVVEMIEAGRVQWRSW